MTKQQTKIVITGGHLTPALAVLNELQKRGYTDISWIGVKHSQTSDKSTSAEYEQVTDLNIDFINFRAGKLWRRWTPVTFLKAIYNLLLIPAGFIRSIFLMLRLKPGIIVSFGGYLAVPIVFAAKLTGTKVVTHEQTLTSGLANKIIARFSNKIFVSWKESMHKFPKGKTVFTGNPIRKQVFITVTAAYKFPDELPVIYVTGGNQGANTINWRLFKILPALLEDANVIHQTGNSTVTNDYHTAAKTKQELPEHLKQRYIFRDNIYGNEIGEVFDKANLIVSRSGANTITELLALGKLSVLIPIPWSSQNEQLKNARLVESTGLALVLEQYDEMKPAELLEAIETGMDVVKSKKDFNGNKLEESRADALKLIKLKAVQNITDQVEEILS